MTIEAEIAKQASYQFEAKKDALKQVQDGSVKVTLTIHPQEMPLSLYGDPMGQRFMCVLVPLNDDETPRVEPSSPVGNSVKGSMKAGEDLTPPRRKWEELSYAERAGIRCNEPLFLEYAQSVTSDVFIKTDQYVRDFCGVSSRSEIKPGTEAARKFDQLEEQYDTWLKYER